MLSTTKCDHISFVAFTEGYLMKINDHLLLSLFVRSKVIALGDIYLKNQHSMLSFSLGDNWSDYKKTDSRFLCNAS
jgi:hypothetical protein